MPRPGIHLIAPAGSCRSFLRDIGVASAGELIDLIQEIVGVDYVVTANHRLIEAGEDESAGGRTDDCERAADIERALGDDQIGALIALRGGAWFSRILPLIDFSVLDARAQPIAVFGFSELTTLVNIVGAHRHGRGIYDMGPAFLRYGLKRHAELHLGLPGSPARGGGSAEDWMRAELMPQVRAYFRDVISMIEGRGSRRSLEAELISGELPTSCGASFVGGNLCVMITLLGSPYRAAIQPIDQWLVLEEVNEKPERLDRFLAHLTLAGVWTSCRGILLGDFHRHDRDLTSEVAAMLPYHLPPDGTIPILVTHQVGHVWPMSPLPLHQPVKIERNGKRSYSLHWPASALRTV